MRHDGKENGRLLAPRRQLEAFGIGEHFVSRAIEEAERLGLVCVFRSIAITDSSGRRSSNPVEGDHGFRSKAITHSSDRDQHGMTG
jgi:hypothetical protein